MNEEQLKAIKSIERAFKKAYKLNLSFWSDYGTLTAFDKTLVVCPCPGEMGGDVAYNSADPDERYFKILNRKIDIQMNSDDPLTFDLK